MGAADGAREQCRAAANLAIHEAERSDLGTALNFASLLPRFENLRVIFKYYADSQSLEALRGDLLSQVENGAKSLVDIHRRMTTFEVRDRGNVQQEHYQLVKRFEQTEREIFDQLMPVATFLKVNEPGREEELQKFSGQVTGVLSAIKADRETAKAEAADALAEIQRIQQDAAKSATATSISSHQQLFAMQALAHRNQSRLWLTAMAVLLSAIAWFSWEMWKHARDLVIEPPLGIAIQQTAIKIAVYTILVTLVLWVGRVYRAAFHNCVVNQHRANALGTFQAFVDGASEEARVAILLQTSGCIFSPQPTGLLSNEPDPHPTSHVVDLARAVSAATGKGTKG